LSARERRLPQSTSPNSESAAAPTWIEMQDVSDQVLRLVRDDTLAGRVVVLGRQRAA
jgi:hypothetical protein